MHDKKKFCLDKILPFALTAEFRQRPQNDCGESASLQLSSSKLTDVNHDKRIILIIYLISLRNRTIDGHQLIDDTAACLRCGDFVTKIRKKVAQPNRQRCLLRMV